MIFFHVDGLFGNFMVSWEVAICNAWAQLPYVSSTDGCLCKTCHALSQAKLFLKQMWTDLVLYTTVCKCEWLTHCILCVHRATDRSTDPRWVVASAPSTSKASTGALTVAPSTSKTSSKSTGKTSKTASTGRHTSNQHDTCVRVILICWYSWWLTYSQLKFSVHTLGHYYICSCVLVWLSDTLYLAAAINLWLHPFLYSNL